MALPSVVRSGMDKHVSVTEYGCHSGELFPAHAAIPATVVAAASFDDAIAITGYTLFINLAVRQGGNTTWSVMHGPLSLVFGVIAGLISGFICSITKLWDNSFKRTLVMFFSSKSPQGTWEADANPCISSRVSASLAWACQVRSLVALQPLSACACVLPKDNLLWSRTTFLHPFWV